LPHIQRHFCPEQQTLLTETWTDRVREYDRELKVVRGAIQQMEQIAFQAQEAVRSVAE
jgi:hypothetical protein